MADFYELLRYKSSQVAPSLSSLVLVSLRELPEVLYLLRAAEHPASIPVSIASMRLVQETTSNFVSACMGLLNESGSIAERFRKVRQLYEIENIPNSVTDGTISFPEDSRSLTSGMSVEFRSVFELPRHQTECSFPRRNVSFKYPGSENMVLRNVSFKLDKGQLCVRGPLRSSKYKLFMGIRQVIVGSNGSGKSTMLKLILRLYDPTEGAIFVNNQDIRTLKLANLRDCVSVLFQDYTHFPLSVS